MNCVSADLPVFKAGQRATRPPVYEEGNVFPRLRKKQKTKKGVAGGGTKKGKSDASLA